jgi:quercetin dioxygenase-like cupin family protein
MAQDSIPFQVIDWTGIDRTEQPGQTGSAFWKTLQLLGLRIRIVTYSPGYLADHWCHKGHIVHCLEGELVTEHENGEKYTLKQGMTCVDSGVVSGANS